MNHAEKMTAYKSAADKQQNDYSLSMAKLKLREQELQMKNNAINHSSVKSQTLIPGQFITISKCLLIFGLVLMSAENSLDKDTTQFLRTHLRYDQTQVTSMSRNSSNSGRTAAITIEYKKILHSWRFCDSELELKVFCLIFRMQFNLGNFHRSLLFISQLEMIT